MKIGIIGAGMVGRAAATVAVKHGHAVMLSNSRHPETLFSLQRALKVETGTPSDAAAFGEIVVIAIPFKAYTSVPAEPLAGKIVIDANNYYPDRDGHFPELDEHRTTSSELLAQHLPKSRIVKALNAISAGDLELEGAMPHGSAARRALPIAGDDAEAKRTVAALLEGFGLAIVDAGPLAEGRRFQVGTPAYGPVLDEEGLRAALGAYKASKC